SFEVGADVLAPGEEVALRGQLLPGPRGADRRAGQGRGVHAERAEQADVAPLAEVLPDPAALVDGDRQPERGGVHRRPPPDGAGAEDRDPRAAHGGPSGGFTAKAPRAPRPDQRKEGAGRQGNEERRPAPPFFFPRFPVRPWRSWRLGGEAPS